MIYNDVCPYCRNRMNQIENDPLCKSVEHLIPNTALTIRRGKGEGDFYACRACNIGKSNIDYVLGVIAKFQSKDVEMAISSVQKALDNPGRKNRFLDMIVSANIVGAEAHMPLPVTQKEISGYINYLAKGQYYKLNQKPLSLKKNIVVFQFINKQVIRYLEKGYQNQHGSMPIQDLHLNPKSEVIADGECVIHSGKDKYLFFFQEGLAFIIEIRPKNNKNLRRREKFLSDFNK